ncbi:MAG: META domain-containing protein [Burkholderiales bacterium]|nr:META domain-containing protein [Burkholderiales bacterium]
MRMRAAVPIGARRGARLASFLALLLCVAPVSALDGEAVPDVRAVRVQAAAPPAKGSPTLRKTYWKLVALDGKPARTFKDQREPHVVLDGNETRVSGSGGCNNLVGGFELDGAHLHFTQMAGTMMMCPDGMEQEAALVKALERTARYRIAGDALTLIDAKGKAIAKFRAGTAR